MNGEERAMKNLGETFFAAVLIVGVGAVIIINNADILASWMAFAQSNVAASAATQTPETTGNPLIQAAIGFLIVSIVAGGFLWLRKPTQQVDANGNPTEVDYNSPDWVRVKVI